jgi:hypothetical protein
MTLNCIYSFEQQERETRYETLLERKRHLASFRDTIREQQKKAYPFNSRVEVPYHKQNAYESEKKKNRPHEKQQIRSPSNKERSRSSKSVRSSLTITPSSDAKSTPPHSPSTSEKKEDKKKIDKKVEQTEQKKDKKQQEKPFIVSKEPDSPHDSLKNDSDITANMDSAIDFDGFGKNLINYYSHPHR